MTQKKLTKQQQFASILATNILVAVACIQSVVCQQSVPPSEPYSVQHFDPYSYGYETEDNYGNKQWKQERSNHPHEVHGSYGYRDNHGVYREVTYVADQNGFRANIKTNEPGVASDKSPASTKIESHAAPPPPPSSSSSSGVSHSSMGHLFSQQAAPLQPPTVTSHHHEYKPASQASPPVYIRQHYAHSPPSYYQSQQV